MSPSNATAPKGTVGRHQEGLVPLQASFPQRCLRVVQTRTGSYGKGEKPASCLLPHVTRAVPAASAGCAPGAGGPTEAPLAPHARAEGEQASKNTLAARHLPCAQEQTLTAPPAPLHIRSGQNCSLGEGWRTPAFQQHPQGAPAPALPRSRSQHPTNEPFAGAECREEPTVPFSSGPRCICCVLGSKASQVSPLCIL